MKLTPARLEMLIRRKDEIDDHVDYVFRHWCTAMGIHPAYGVHRWDLSSNSTVDIVQDITCRGCTDYDYHKIPVAWLFMSPDELQIAVEELKQKVADEKKQKKVNDKKRKIAALENQLRELREEG